MVTEKYVNPFTKCNTYDAEYGQNEYDICKGFYKYLDFKTDMALEWIKLWCLFLKGSALLLIPYQNKQKKATQVKEI